MGDSGPEAAVKGVVEDVKGKAKEVAGIVTDNTDLREEGRAQQDKIERLIELNATADEALAAN